MNLIKNSFAQVSCTLEYWNEDSASFTVLEPFQVSESTPVDVCLANPLPSRRWRICINEVEWVDEENEEVFVSK